MKRIVYAAPDAIADVAEAAFHKPVGLTVREIAEYLNKTQRYALNAATAALTLGIVALKDEVYTITQEASDLAKATMSQRPTIFRKFLIRFDPFVHFRVTVVERIRNR